MEVNFRVWFSDRYPGSLLIFYNLFLIADINECDEGTADCVNGAECINVNGSYTCQCRVGFQKTADNCTGVRNINRDLHVFQFMFKFMHGTISFGCKTGN